MAGADISSAIDPITAVFEKYYADMPGPRTPVSSTDGRFAMLLDDDIDGVVFSLPPWDSVHGWEYPHQRNRLDALGVPHLILRGDPGDPSAVADDRDRLARFLDRAADRRAGRSHGR
jgi:hypothetical protein